MGSRLLLKVACLAAVLQALGAFYLPGTAREYREGEPIPMDTNVLASINTHLPYEYYHLPFCKPAYNWKKTDGSDNIGLIIMGDRIRKSPYDKVQMKKNFKCKRVCNPILLDGDRRKVFEQFIKEEYFVTLLLDALPVSMHNPETNTYTAGFPIGTYDKQSNNYIVYNHLEFDIKYTKAENPDAFRIVAFHVKPYSVKHGVTDGKWDESACDENMFDPAVSTANHLTSDSHLAFSYSIKFEYTTESWATRWSVLFPNGDAEIHWFSIGNSIMVLLFLTGMVGVIIVRTLRRDISKYNSLDEDIQDEYGWKLLHRDVFRPPANKLYLAAYVGTGVQIIEMLISVLICACLGLLSPANRGALFTTMILCFVLLGVYGGYTTSRLMRTWGASTKDIWVAVIMTGVFVTGQIFVVFFVINLFVWHAGSSAAVPFLTMLTIMLLWLVVMLSLVVMGGAVGMRKDKLWLPCRIGQLERVVPAQPWYLHPVSTTLMGGVLPFGAVFIEVFFILSGIWTNRYYYVFGFLFIVFIILVVTCCEITIVMVYFQLCAEDYRWWWRAFLTCGSSGLYIFLYSAFYFFSSTLRIRKFVSVLLFFGYMLCISYVFAIVTGTIGFLSAFVFIRLIYASIKVD